MAVHRAKLPTYGSHDGDQIIDSEGNIYEYNAERGEWIYLGVVPDPDVVTIDEHGLISPDIYRKLALLQELIEAGVDFSKFKLSTKAGNPYYYLFHSSDDLIRFIPEKLIEPKEVKGDDTVLEVGTENNQTFVKLSSSSNYTSKSLVGLELETLLGNHRIVDNSNNVIIIGRIADIKIGDRVKIVKPTKITTRLRIEVDRGRLYQKLVRNCCIGPKGRKGVTGLLGLPGKSSADETLKSPSNTDNGIFEWSTKVNIPITTPISLRIFRQNEEESTIEIFYPIEPNESIVIAINDDTIDIEESSLELSYEPTTKLFSGSIKILEGGEDIDTWHYKARQRGSKGEQGDSGKPFFDIVTQLLDDTSVQSQEAMIAMRKAIASDNIVILNNSLFDTIPASKLAAFDGDSIVDIAEDKFVSAKVTIREAKKIETFQFVPPDLEIPPLELPLWTPTKDCVQSKRWTQYRFDWFDRVEPKYLWHIIPTPKPPEQCCQEDFFFCPNLGDTPCIIEGEIKTPIPFPVPCECECENPVSGQFFGGGLTLDPIDLTLEEYYIVEIPIEESTNTTSVTVGTGTESETVQQIGTWEPENVVVENPNALIPADKVKASGINIAESVINGTIQTFLQDIILLGNGEIRISLDYDSDICGGDVEERKSKAFVDSDAIGSILTLEDINGSTSISNDGIWNTQTIPVNVAFTVSGPVRIVDDEVPEVDLGNVAILLSEDDDIPEGVSDPQYTTTIAESAHLRLTARINTTEANYCKGYRITITVKSDRTDRTISRTFIVVPSSVTPVTPTVEPIIDMPELPEIDPPEELPFTAPESFAPDGKIIDGTTSIDELVETGGYIIGFTLDGGTVINVSDNSLIVTIGEAEKVGSLIKSPVQVPLHQDNINLNCKINIGVITLFAADTGFDRTGMFGIGTYILGDITTTMISSVIPSTNVRTDHWTDVIGFFNQPQSYGEESHFTIIGRLDSGVLIDHANSLFMDELFNSELSEGFISIILRSPHIEPMEAIKNAQIINYEYGEASITYYGDELANIYPQILIGSAVSP